MSYPTDAIGSGNLYKRACRVLPGGNTRSSIYMRPFPLYAVRGKGSKVWDADGKERVDCNNNFTSLIHGHANQDILKAVEHQLQLGTCFGLPTESEIDLAEILVERLPTAEQIRFTNSGTEAVMMAMKAARAYTGHPKIAKVEGSYHGTYDFAEVSLDSSPENWGDKYPHSVAYSKATPGGVLNDVVVLPFNDIETSNQILEQNAGQIAAVIVDPLPSHVSLIPARKDFIESLTKKAHEIGSLLIFDEVISFRLGFNGAQGLWDAKPDLTTLGKIIGGGFPVGAIGGSKDIMSVFDPSKGNPAVPHAGTFSANPVTMTAGIKSMKLLDREAILHLNEMGQKVRDSLNQIFKDFDVPGYATGVGSLLNVHFGKRAISDYRTAYQTPQEKEMLKIFHLGLLDNGVFAASSGFLAMSTAMTDADIDTIIAAATKATEAIKE